MKRAVRTLTVTTAVVLMAGSAALAQTKPGMAPPPPQTAPSTSATPGSEEWLRQRGESYHSAPESEQDPAEVAATARLNAEIVDKNASAASLEGEEEAEHERAEANYQADLVEAARAQEQWESDRAAADAARAQWERDQAVWEANARACERAGGRNCRPMDSAPKG